MSMLGFIIAMACMIGALINLYVWRAHHQRKCLPLAIALSIIFVVILIVDARAA